jgi:DNA-binding response OmpR family regulator
MRVATFLIIDDDPDMREILTTVLEADGHTVVATNGGRAGLAAIGQQPVNIIITDIVMPDIEGIELIRKLRKLDRGAKIVAISAAPDYLEMARDLGADEVMAKPIGIAPLRALVARLLGTSA